MPAIEIRNLVKEFDVPGGVEVAVNDISLTIDDGEFVTIVGPSGCGKTTTLRCLAGLETPTRGSILVNGEDITGVPPNERRMAMMFQDIALYPHMTNEANIGYPLKVRGETKKERKKKTREAAEIMEISELLEKKPAQVSGGQQQRIALARTIVQDPIAFLMDEPLSDLDAALQVRIRKEIQKVHRRLAKPTVYVTHNQEEAMTMSDRIVVMNDGSIEQVGTRDEIYNHPKNLFVAQFIGEPSINVMDASVKEQEGEKITFKIDSKETSVKINKYSNSQLESDVQLGIRPHDLTLDDSTNGSFSVEGQIYLIEPIDNRAIASIETSFGEFTVLVPSQSDFDEGDEIHIHLDLGKIYVFSRQSGELLGKTTGEAYGENAYASN